MIKGLYIRAMASRILEAIVSDLGDDAPVTDVGVYLHATAVTSRRMGLAYTFPKRSIDGARHRHEIVAGSGRLTDFSAIDLARYALSCHPIEASIGVAAINSVISLPERALIERNGVEIVMEYAAGRRLAVIGHFPFVERARPAVRALWVLELDPSEGDLPAEEAPNIVPMADVVAITGTAFINHTIDGLLELARGKRIIILGPSTILSARLFDLGVSALCGVFVEDPEAVTRHLKEGGSFRHLPGVRYVAMTTGPITRRAVTGACPRR